MEKETQSMNEQERNIYDRRRCAYPLGYNAEKNPPYIKRLSSYYLCILVTVLHCLTRSCTIRYSVGTNFPHWLPVRSASQPASQQ